MSVQQPRQQQQRLGAMLPVEPASGWVPGMGTSMEDAPVGSKAHSSEGGSEDERCCWLCLGGEDEGLGALTAPCRYAREKRRDVGCTGVLSLRDLWLKGLSGSRLWWCAGKGRQRVHLRAFLA